MSNLTVVIGYDFREDLAARVCAASIQKYAHKAVDIMFYSGEDAERDFGGVWREQGAATSFSRSRFLSPKLTKTEWTLFVDCDFVFLDDVWHIVNEADRSIPTGYDPKPVYCVHHDVDELAKRNDGSVKMDDKPQEMYPFKWWSSLMLFNGRGPFTVGEISRMSSRQLHRFDWLDRFDDSFPGKLDKRWNYLEGYNRPEDLKPGTHGPGAIHFTRGGPWLAGQKVQIGHDEYLEWAAHSENFA